MKKIQLILFLSCLLLMGCGTSEKKSVAIVPQPQSCDVQAGSYTFAAGGAFSSNLSGSELDDLSAVLASSPFRLTASEDAGAAFRFERVDSLPGISSAEGYRLTVGADGVRAEATTSSGLFYAFQSLLQLADDEGGRFSLPFVRVSDYPRFGYRGLHLDVSRHFRSKEFVMKQLDAIDAAHPDCADWTAARRTQAGNFHFEALADLLRAALSGPASLPDPP